MTDKTVTTTDLGKRLKTFYENFDFFENFVIKPITAVADDNDFQSLVVGVNKWVGALDTSTTPTVYPSINVYKVDSLIKAIDSSVNAITIEDGQIIITAANNEDPLVWQIVNTNLDSRTNTIITSYSINEYNALIFEVSDIYQDVVSDISAASISIRFKREISNATIIIVGGGGGGGYSAGSGGGGGGTTILSNQTLTAGTTYDITVGNGGSGGVASVDDTILQSGGSGNYSSFSTYTSYGGGGGSFADMSGIVGSNGGGNGGNINSEFGGGGGGGGVGGSGVNIAPGTGGSNSSLSNSGSAGTGLQYVSGESKVDGYNYAGSGGASYYSLNNIPILTPFISSSSSILVGGGGAGGGSGDSVTPNNVGGYAGSGVGGIYGYPENYGETSTSYISTGYEISTGYGNGGGGGASGNGGAGGAGVVIIYWQ